MTDPKERLDTTAEDRTSSDLTRSRIIEAAIDMLSWCGADHLSMSAVARSAKVSRQTVYRYFANMDALQVGIMDHLQKTVTKRFVRRFEEDSTLEGRLYTISEYDTDARSGRPGMALLDSEPAFMLKFLNSHAADICPYLELALEPFIRDAELRSGIKVDVKLFVEILMRIRLSVFLVPGDSASELAVRSVRVLVSSLLESPHHWAIQNQ